MIQDLLLGLLKANIAGSAMILLVLALRRPVRRVFGARVAYGLWWLPLLGAAAVLLPARRMTVEAASQPSGFMPELAAASLPAASADASNLWALAAALWIGGVALSAAGLALSQARFLAHARRGRAGPAVVGFLRPVVVVPADFQNRFDPAEREVVLAHEQAHIKRQDSRVVALAAAVRCLNWFNPLVHLAVLQMRIDQELACDAQVVGENPGRARLYAETMVKAQLTALPLPVGCAWPAGGLHPLAERVALLAQRRPSRARVFGGAALIAALGLSGSALAWAAQPPRTVPIRAPVESAPAPRIGDVAESVPAARSLLPAAVPTKTQGETKMTSSTPSGKARRAAAAAALAAGIGTVSVAAPVSAQEAEERYTVFQTQAPAGVGGNGQVVQMSGRRSATGPEADARQGALNEALGLPADTQSALNCRVGTGMAPSCAVSVSGADPVPLTEAQHAALVEKGLIQPVGGSVMRLRPSAE